ncbi:Bifunctional epoxide hydrolase 2 [Leucoagaricus sp. SymC.cos]|nr:Bifunctional epoxide hydrolase 2 [Leucoagaricus sp. SymC.cos]
MSTPDHWPSIPNEVTSRKLIVGDLNVHIFECLPLTLTTAPNTKPPLIVLLHGFPELAYSWRKILVPLAKAGYHVVAPDQRGYGLTTPISTSNNDDAVHRVAYEDDLRPYHILNFAADVISLILALGHEKAHAVVGHDFGSSVAAWTALVRPDIVERVVLMSAPFGGPPNPSEVESVKEKEDSKAYLVDLFLRKLATPRKHYTVYYSTPEANAEMVNPPEGLKAFLRAYYHVKSADWEGNEKPLPAPLALAMEALPHYYIMPAGLTMPETVRPYFPRGEGCTWLTDEELEVYTSIYSRTGFQGGLNRYRSMTDETWNAEAGVRVMGGKRIEVPTRFIAGAMDWGTWQVPGTAEAMRSEKVVKGEIRDEDFVIVEGAGHWVQQEQPEKVVKALLDFFA